MSDVYKISVDGSEVARVSGEGITPAKKLLGGAYSTDFVDDLKMLKLVRDRKTVLVFYVSAAANVSVERVSDGS